MFIVIIAINITISCSIVLTIRTTAVVVVGLIKSINSITVWNERSVFFCGLTWIKLLFLFQLLRPCYRQRCTQTGPETLPLVVLYRTNKKMRGKWIRFFTTPSEASVLGGVGWAAYFQPVDILNQRDTRVRAHLKTATDCRMHTTDALSRPCCCVFMWLFAPMSPLALSRRMSRAKRGPALWITMC